MTGITLVPPPSLSMKRRAIVLTEHRVGHYSEFRDFFIRAFDLERVRLVSPGYVAAPSGMIYELIFIGRSGEPFPAGLEIFALPDALEPLHDADVDRDLWAILGWMIEGVGPPWSRADLEATGRLYRIPAAR